MKPITIAAAAFLALMPTAAAVASGPESLRDCREQTDPDRVTQACSSVIDAGASETARNRATAYIYRAGVYLQKNDRPRALADYDAAIATDPTFSHGFFQRGLFYHRGGDLVRAKADYDTALKLDAKLIPAYLNRGTIHYQLLSYRLALADFDSAVALKPDDPDLLHNRGLARLALGRIDPAISDFSRALEHAPQFPRFWFNRGRAQAAKTEFAAAASDFAAALERDSGYTLAQTCLTAAKEAQAAKDAKRRPFFPMHCLRDVPTPPRPSL
ncbi:TPR repeat-containing protein YrrB [Variibacter gotjawalensis]|uniref:TPR repeat-containing protein YrrB n=1 Tax=Variibacter gotjawalensis TaxID=1333996 RepID=A0A0S3PXY8_9BRAD|nr:tetratricopeptide repeat protein [Variibacter gotjawalensis]NIK46640.1 tetratricopeptide (TPR) repeat protein [Variibacter gotjawalensis]RZS48543.1 tetratricopeptide repeat protein [Variibacter gotjawalensis]BAT60805.1 TPR repeat-containing protein YrrB [Variibacter gotjawalensis]